MFQRSDGRDLNALRPLEIQRGYTKHADGSVLIAYGDTKVLVTASVEERVPKHVMQEGNHIGWLTAEYSLLPGSTNTRCNRERFRLSGRTSEIQRLIGRSLRASVDLSRLGQRTITIDADVIQADGGTRVAAITGGYIALMDALLSLKEKDLLEALPIISPVAAVSVGLVDGEVLLDLTYEEDFQAQVDANVVMNQAGQIIEFQATSEKEAFSREQMIQMLDTAHHGIQQLFQQQENVLQALTTTH